MRHTLKGLSVLLFLFSLRLYAYIPSEGNVTASYGLFLYKTNFSGSDQVPTSPVLGDVGIITNGDLNDKGSLEITLFHMNKIYYRDQGSRALAEKTELIHIMLGYRRWIDERFSIAAGLYSSYPMNQYKILHSDGNLDLEMDTSARDTSEFGAEFSLQTEVWSRDKDAITFDLRYAYSMSNKGGEKGDHYGAFVSYRVMVQEKVPPASTTKEPQPALAPGATTQTQPLVPPMPAAPETGAPAEPQPKPSDQ